MKEYKRVKKVDDDVFTDEEAICGTQSAVLDPPLDTHHDGYCELYQEFSSSVGALFFVLHTSIKRSRHRYIPSCIAIASHIRRERKRERDAEQIGGAGVGEVDRGRDPRGPYK